MSNNNHEYYEFLISRGKDNDLDSAEKLELKEHLECCCGCVEFNAKINKLSTLVKLEESPVILETAKQNKKLAFSYKYIFSAAAAVLMVVGAAIFLSNSANKKAIDGRDIIASSAITNNNSVNTIEEIDNANTSDVEVLSYDINSKYDNSAPLAIFFDDYADNTADYSEPMETYLAYSLSDAK